MQRCEDDNEKNVIFVFISSLVIGFLGVILKMELSVMDVSFVYQILCVLYSFIIVAWSIGIIINYDKLHSYWRVETPQQEMNFRGRIVFCISFLLAAATYGYLW